MQKAATKTRADEAVEEEVPQQRDDEVQEKIDEADGMLAEIDDLLQEQVDEDQELNNLLATMDDDTFMPFCGC